MPAISSMKRGREDGEIEALHMVDCSISFSKSTESHQSDTMSGNSRGRVFVCKTCNREFSSFQALGGHRASHRKPRVLAGDVPHNIHSLRPKGHECSICGLEFPVGQALGGHMRRHRNNAPSEGLGRRVEESPTGMEYDAGDGSVVGLDLNLTPLENDLIRLQLLAPAVDCFT